jgi:UDP-N-acetylglucosamine acyltransferase
MKRRGFESDTILSIKRAYKEIYRKKQSIDDALSAITDQSTPSPELELFTDSITQSTRGIIR